MNNITMNLAIWVKHPNILFPCQQINRFDQNGIETWYTTPDDQRLRCQEERGMNVKTDVLARQCDAWPLETMRQYMNQSLHQWCCWPFFKSGGERKIYRTAHADRQEVLTWITQKLRGQFSSVMTIRWSGLARTHWEDDINSEGWCHRHHDEDGHTGHVIRTAGLIW